MSENEFKPGWLKEQVEKARADVAGWPAWMKVNADICPDCNGSLTWSGVLGHKVCTGKTCEYGKVDLEKLRALIKPSSLRAV